MNLPFTDFYILKRYGKTLPSPNPKTFSFTVPPLGFLHEKNRHGLCLHAFSVPLLLKHVSSSLLLLAANVSVLPPRPFDITIPVIFSCSSCKTWPHFVWIRFLYFETKNFFLSQSGLIFGAYYSNIGRLGRQVVVTMTPMTWWVDLTVIQRRCGLR